MKRRLLVALLVAGVVCAGVGTALSGDPFGPLSFGWTAYAPLSHATYQPIDVRWLVQAHRIGLALLALGAGTTGAAVAALVVLGRSRRTR